MYNVTNPLEIFQTILGEGRKVGKSWEFPCPKCGNSKSLHVRPDKEWSFWCDGNGFMCDFSGGSPNKLIREYGDKKIELIKEALFIDKVDKTDWELVKSICCYARNTGVLTYYHQKWMNQRGLKTNKNFFSSESVIKELKSRYSATDLISSGLFIKPEDKDYIVPAGVLGKNRLVICYQDIEDKTIYLRSRAIYDCQPGMKYRAMRNVPQNKMVWGLPQLKLGLRKITVTEGELKAEASVQAEVPCLGQPGMANSQEAVADYLAEHGVEEVPVIYDSDGRIDRNGDNKQAQIDYHASKLIKLLKDRHIDSYQIKLPLFEEDKMDIDHFILVRGAKFYKKVIGW